uniref:Luc7-like protein n=1 Tax=Heterorhabditis bacteriophora TaxID=37862 RepID=A0A1I7XSV9_HETBA
MTDMMREMIAQLMGTQKEGEEGRDLPPYDHPSVCRAYLVGCCPYELVPDSRLQGLVSCRKTHEPAHKADYQKAQKERDHFYDVDAFDILENAIRVVDMEVTRIKDKLDREAKEQTDNAELVKAQRIAELNEKISRAVEEMEALGNMGKVEESMRLSKNVEELRTRKAELEGQTEFRLAGPGSNAARLRVCDDCGAQLNVLDHETRIADHFGGKMHLGMVECREKYDIMKKTIDGRRKDRREKMGDQSSRYTAEKRYYRFSYSYLNCFDFLNYIRRSPPRRDRDDRRDRHGGSSGRRRSRSRSRDRDRRRDDHRDDRRGGSNRDRDR